MPILPLAHWVQAELKKPFVRGIGNNLLDRQQFKYAWIDTNWRPRDAQLPRRTPFGRRRPPALASCGREVLTSARH